MALKDPRAFQTDTFLFSGPVLPLQIGSVKTQFFIHKALLLSRASQFWRDAIDLYNRTPKASALGFSLLDPTIFDLYHQYLYTGKIPCRRTNKEAEAELLIRFYDLSTTLLDDLAKDASINALIILNHIPSPRLVTLAYSFTTPISKLRHLLVDLYVAEANPLLTDGKPLPEEFRDELLGAMTVALRMGGERREVKERVCEYHEHGREEGCTMREEEVEDGEMGEGASWSFAVLGDAENRLIARQEAAVQRQGGETIDLLSSDGDEDEPEDERPTKRQRRGQQHT